MYCSVSYLLSRVLWKYTKTIQERVNKRKQG